MVVAHLEYLLVAWEYIYPLQAESKHFRREFKDLLHISLRRLAHQRDKRVEVQIHLTSNELGAFGRVVEAKEIAVNHSLDPVEHGHLVGVVHVEFSERHLALAGVALSIFPECGDS